MRTWILFLSVTSLPTLNVNKTVCCNSHQSYCIVALLPLSRQILVQPILYGTVIPLVGYFTFKKLILDPMEERRRAQEKGKQMEAAREKVAEARKEATASIDLMRERFNRIRHDEASRGGLVILAAVYGKLLDGGLWFLRFYQGVTKGHYNPEFRFLL